MRKAILVMAMAAATATAAVAQDVAAQGAAATYTNAVIVSIEKGAVTVRQGRGTQQYTVEGAALAQLASLHKGQGVLLGLDAQGSHVVELRLAVASPAPAAAPRAR